MAAAEAWARQEKVRKFVDQRLKPDLANAIAQLDKVFEQQKTFLDLKRNIENLERNGVTSMRSMVNLGSEVYMQAEVPDTRHIFVDIGLGFHVEFTWQEALQFISVREARLTSRHLLSVSHSNRQEWVFSICSASPAIGGSTSPASGASTLFGDQQQVPPPSPGARYFEDELLDRCCSSISARNWSLGRGVLDTSEIKPHKQIDEYTHLIASIKAQVKLVCEGIREVLQLPAEKELSPRNTW